MGILDFEQGVTLASHCLRALHLDWIRCLCDLASNFALVLINP